MSADLLKKKKKKKKRPSLRLELEISRRIIRDIIQTEFLPLRDQLLTYLGVPANGLTHHPRTDTKAKNTVYRYFTFVIS